MASLGGIGSDARATGKVDRGAGGFSGVPGRSDGGSGVGGDDRYGRGVPLDPGWSNDFTYDRNNPFDALRALFDLAQEYKRELGISSYPGARERYKAMLHGMINAANRLRDWQTWGSVKRELDRIDRGGALPDRPVREPAIHDRASFEDLARVGAAAVKQNLEKTARSISISLGLESQKPRSLLGLNIASLEKELKKLNLSKRKKVATALLRAWDLSSDDKKALNRIKSKGV